MEYNIKAKVWVYPGMGGWHFITVPKKQSNEIKLNTGLFRRGWGSIPVMVRIGKTKWKTSIFPDTKSKSYLLPIKADVRKKENIVQDTMILIHITIIG